MVHGVSPEGNMSSHKATRSGAAEVRALVPYGGEVLTGLMAGHEGAGPVTLSVHEAMKHLHQCYKLLGWDFAEQVEAGEMLMHGLAFHHLIVTLHGVDPERRLLQPKHHMFLEMLGEKTRPSLYWTYREESFGGSLSRQGLCHLDEPRSVVQALFSGKGAANAL